jgi:hypothetical protein
VGGEDDSLRTKVFCIGFQKTGTTSMMQALTLLGYRVTGPNHVHDKDIAEKFERVAAELSHRFDAFQDHPWPLVYRQMDALHPGSKFILTVRDEQKWYDSYRNHFEDKEPTPMAVLFYGPQAGCFKDPEIYKGRMRRHNLEVREYFRDRPDDLLVIDVTRDQRWEPICAFLGLPFPDVPFPHSNPRKYTFLPPKTRALLKKGWRRLGRLWAKIRPRVVQI